MVRVLQVAAFVVIGFAVLVVCTYFGAMRFVEYQRFQDVDPAFRPLAHLRPQISSNPIAFDRYCVYSLQFRQDSPVSDDNIEELLSLNHFPAENELWVYITTPRVTDRSVPHLLELTGVDYLDVTGTSITDAGIERLRAHLGEHVVSWREVATTRPQPTGASP